MNKIKKILAEAMKYIIFIVASTIWLIFMLFAMNYNVFASTSISDYTNVADDLMNVSDFDFADFPSLDFYDVYDKNNDVDITNDVPYVQVIQIAESSSNELYIYTYQPINETVEILCSSVKISADFSSDSNIKNIKVYYLELLSTYKTFCKYVVKDFEVCSEAYRYYNIVSIYRYFNKDLDNSVVGGEITEKDISVGQQWCAYYLNDKLIYEMNTFNTLELDIIYSGNLEFKNGITWGNLLGSFKRGLAWFVCFNCEEYIIKKIFDADLTYQIREMSYSTGFLIDPIPTYYPYGSNYDDNQAIKKGDTDYETGGFSEFKKPLTKDDVGTFEGEGLCAKNYSWNRISSSSDFIRNIEKQNIDCSDEMKKQINNSQWVFAFLETEQTSTVGSVTTYFSKDVGNISILRLHFMDINKTYNLGVVADKINPDNISDGLGSGLDLDIFDETFQKIMMLIGIIVLIVLLCVCAPLLNVIITVGKVLFKAIGFVISLPFKLIGSLFGSKKKF